MNAYQPTRTYVSVKSLVLLPQRAGHGPAYVIAAIYTATHVFMVCVCCVCVIVV